MKRWIKIAVLALVAVAGSTLLGGSLWIWLVGVIVGRFALRLILTIMLALALYCVVKIVVYALVIGGILWILIN